MSSQRAQECLIGGLEVRGIGSTPEVFHDDELAGRRATESDAREVKRRIQEVGSVNRGGEPALFHPRYIAGSPPKKVLSNGGKVGAGVCCTQQERGFASVLVLKLSGCADRFRMGQRGAGQRGIPME